MPGMRLPIHTRYSSPKPRGFSYGAILESELRNHMPYGGVWCLDLIPERHSNWTCWKGSLSCYSAPWCNSCRTSQAGQAPSGAQHFSSLLCSTNYVWMASEIPFQAKATDHTYPRAPCIHVYIYICIHIWI